MQTTDPAEIPELRGSHLVLAMTATCMTIVGYNTTAVVTILPDLRTEFDLTPAGLQWVMAVYSVSSATLVLILSRLGDVTGKMKVFFFGMAVFALGSLAIIVAPSGGILLAGRAI